MICLALGWRDSWKIAMRQTNGRSPRGDVKAIITERVYDRSGNFSGPPPKRSLELTLFCVFLVLHGRSGALRDSLFSCIFFRDGKYIFLTFCCLDFYGLCYILFNKVNVFYTFNLYLVYLNV